MRAIRTAAALTILASLTAPGWASAASSTLMSETVTESHWTTLPITSDGSRFTMRWSLPRGSQPIQIGAWVYRADHSFLGGFDSTSFQYRNAQYVDSNVIPGVPIHVDQTTDVYDYPLNISTTNQYPGTPGSPITSIALLWWQGAIAGGVPFAIEGPPGIVLGQPTSGTNLTLRMSRDFDAALGAGIQRSVPPTGQTPYGIGPGAQAAVLATTTFAASGNATAGRWSRLGQGSPFGVQARKMTIRGASGWTRECSPGDCYFYGTPGADALPPGEFTFEQTGAGAGIGPFGDSMLYVVDFNFP